MHPGMHQGGIMATKKRTKTEKQDALPDTFSLRVWRTSDGWVADAGRGAVEGTGWCGLLQALTGALKTLARDA
ncbi:hypothetical protein Mx9_p95 [Myxococcus phage Mx9]|nr:hypothetical protein Mx9_p95 [Myxococcus phage Mx9]